MIVGNFIGFTDFSLFFLQNIVYLGYQWRPPKIRTLDVGLYWGTKRTRVKKFRMVSPSSCLACIVLYNPEWKQYLNISFTNNLPSLDEWVQKWHFEWVITMSFWCHWAIQKFKFLLNFNEHFFQFCWNKVTQYMTVNILSKLRLDRIPN